MAQAPAPARYFISSSVQGLPGTLNVQNYTPGGMITGGVNPLDPTAPYDQHMDAGIFTQIVLRNARGKLLYANPNWMQEQPIQAGHKPRAVFFKVSDMVVDEQNPNTYRLMEGTVPNTNLSMQMSIVEIAPQQYGVVTYYTDIVGAVSYLNFRTILMERLGWAIGRIIDAQVKTYLLASVSKLSFGSEGPGNITWQRLLRLWTQLEALDIEPPTSEGEFYPIIIHPHMQGDLLNDDDIRAAIEHSNIGWDPARNPMVHPARLGEAAGFRFYVTSRCATFDATPGGPIDGYACMIFGRELLGVTSFESGDVGARPNFGAVYASGDTFNNSESSPVTLIEKAPGSGGATGDPIDQVGSIGAKWTWGLSYCTPAMAG